MNRQNLLILLCMLLLFPVSGQSNNREKYNFNPGWLLYIGDTPGAERTDFSDENWKKITLPRAFNEDEAFKVHIWGMTDTIAWYRKHFRLPKTAKGKKVFIEFEGVRQAADFYLNGKHIGLHENGVMAVGFDLTPFLNFGGENVIALRTDNDWRYKERSTGSLFQWNDRNFNANYGGVPKNVWLHITDKLYQTLPLYSLVKEEQMAAPLNKKKILIIEDDTDIREFLKKEISVYFEVVAEADGVAGFERARTYDADLIICDVLMPGMNGYEVTRKLKNEFSTSHIPIILLTAMGTTENKLEGVESGADAYVTKPFSLKLLLARMVQLIDQREKLREKYVNDPSIERPAIYTSDKDKQFLDKLQAIIEQELGNSEFTMEDFAARMKLGRTVFSKKVRGLTGHTPNEYFRIIRLKKAAELLLEGNYNVSEVSYKVGISDPLYFSRCFKTHYGVSPSVYLRGKEKEI